MYKYSYKIAGFVLITFLLFQHGCDNYCEVTDYEDYLPLKVGNKWHYKSAGNPEHSWEVIGKKEIDGKLYHVINDTISPDYSRYYYYRFDKSKLWEWTEFDSLAHVIADFALKEGDSFYQPNTGYEVTVLSDNPDEFKFYYDHPEWIDEEHDITFAIDKGIINRCSIWGICLYLVNYEIN